MQSPIKDKTQLVLLLTRRKEIIKAFGVKQLGLFGSFAKDTGIHKESDIDFLVEFEQGEKTYDNFMNLIFYLEDISGRKVKLITRQSLNKYIGPHILKQVENVVF